MGGYSLFKSGTWSLLIKKKPFEGGRREAGGAENIMGSGEGTGLVADFYLIYLKLWSK